MQAGRPVPERIVSFLPGMTTLASVVPISLNLNMLMVFPFGLGAEDALLESSARCSEAHFGVDFAHREWQNADTPRYPTRRGRPRGTIVSREQGAGPGRILNLTEYQVKTAVFRIGISGATALVCVPMSSLQSACALETRLTAQAGKNGHIQFLGRFEDVCYVTTIEEVEGLLLGGLGNQGLDRFRKRRQSARMQSDEAKGTQEGRIRRYQRPSQTPA